MSYVKPSRFHYGVAQAASWLVSTFVFRRKVLRNEIKGVKGPFVVVANHQAMLDFVNVIGLSARPMSFVISNSFYSSMPIKGFMDKMGVIPKQQFQTSAKDLKRIKSVVNAGEPVVIYPAGLMCEDGLSTPIPSATYKFIKWLGVDVYAAKTSGTYFVMPKWGAGMRPGRTYIDVYKLFSKEELPSLSEEEIKSRTDEALLFDAYREQEQLKVSYSKIDDLKGLENVLYRCPHCGEEFSMEIRGRSTICCTKCGFAHTGDKLGLLHNSGKTDEELKYVSDWSRSIFEAQKEKILQGQETSLASEVEIKMVDSKKNKFVTVGKGGLKFEDGHFLLDGMINDEEAHLEISTVNIPTLPFSPGKHLELQQGQTIYRCIPDDPRIVMKFINMVKASFDIRKGK